MFLPLTDCQQRVIDFAVDSWDRQSPLLVTGAAGTGKTTIAGKLVDELGFASPAYLTPTGKAAVVLRGKLDCYAHLSTIHRAIFSPTVDEEDEEEYNALADELKGTRNSRRIREIRTRMRMLCAPRWRQSPQFVWSRKNYSEEHPEVDVIVVDEASMVGVEIGEHLLKLANESGIPVIAVGDPFQLQPVNDTQIFTPARCCAAPVMQEIMRQAEGSEIITLATKIRKGDKIRKLSGKSVDVYPPSSRVDLWDYDIILAGKNATRCRINETMRIDDNIAGLMPQQDEPLVCKLNSYQLGIMNGEVFDVVDCWIDDDDMFCRGVLSDGREFTSQIEIQDDVGSRPFTQYGDVMPVNFAYCLTVHAAQGSEWSDVLVIDEGDVFRKEAAKWRYTAVTRAREGLTLTRGVPA